MVRSAFLVDPAKLAVLKINTVAVIDAGFERFVCVRRMIPKPFFEVSPRKRFALLDQPVANVIDEFLKAVMMP